MDDMDGHHPLLRVLLAAADGVFPPVDGHVEFLPPLRTDLEAVVSFTGHAFVATRLFREDFTGLALDGFGAVLQPMVIQRLTGPGAEVGVIDVTLVARGAGGGWLRARSDLDEHPRVQHARASRRQVRVYGDERGLVTVAHGLAGRTELSVEVFPGQQGHGAGPALIRDAVQLVPAGEPVFAAVSPGNARSLRAFLAVGFRPLGSEVLIRRADKPPGRGSPRGPRDPPYQPKWCGGSRGGGSSALTESRSGLALGRLARCIGGQSASGLRQSCL